MSALEDLCETIKYITF